MKRSEILQRVGIVPPPAAHEHGGDDPHADPEHSVDFGA